MPVLLVSFFLFLLLLGNAENCEDMITNHLGTKSPYRYVANINCTKDNNLQGGYSWYEFIIFWKWIVTGCAKKIWMLVRHGTRNPNVLQIQKMQGYLPILKDIILERNSNLSSSKLKQINMLKQNQE